MRYISIAIFVLLILAALLSCSYIGVYTPMPNKDEAIVIKNVNARVPVCYQETDGSWVKTFGSTDPNNIYANSIKLDNMPTDCRVIGSLYLGENVQPDNFNRAAQEYTRQRIERTLQSLVTVYSK